MEAGITSTEGRRFSIARHGPGRAGDGGFWSFGVRVATAESSASAVVHDLGPGLVEYWTGLAEAWRGWNGERRYTSLEGQLTIVATSDDLGQVDCTITLGQPGPPRWSLAAQMSFGGGSHLQQFATELVRAVV